MALKKHLPKIILISSIILGGFLRFYKLDWGEGYYFHPDESNIANLSLYISHPSSQDFFTKGTFAYGSFIPYLVFFIRYLTKIITLGNLPNDPFKFTIISLRFISALTSTSTIILVYFTIKKFWNKNIALLAAGLIAFSPGLIQSAHFGTFESVLIFLYLGIFYTCLLFLQKGNYFSFFVSLLLVSISSSIKINSLILLPFPIFTLFLILLKKIEVKKILLIPLGIILTFLFTIFLSPYYLTQPFKSMFAYEQHVVTGALDVFYTRQFIGTIPIVFQFTKILPYISNVFIVASFIICIVIISLILIRNIITIRKIHIPSPNIVLFAFWAVMFFPSAFLFTKWTRYTLLSLPFMLILLSVILNKLFKKYYAIISLVLLTICLFYSLMFASVYFNRDIRISSSKWIFENIKNNSFLLSETANVVDIPIYSSEYLPVKNFKLINFDFYNLDGNNELLINLINDLERSDYILVPSRRLFISLGQKPDKFPLVTRYYQLLFSGKLGFEKIKEFDSFPKLGRLTINDESAEETWSVFDHPVIRIYKKTVSYPSNYYRLLLQQ